LVPEIFLRLDHARRGSLGTQLQGELREAVRTGRLAAGERLPSTRALARELGVSRGLAQDCYEQLVAEGYLVARPGSGTRVSPAARPVGQPATVRTGLPRPAIDFRLGMPDLSSFPRADWLWALAEVSRSATVDAFGYGEPMGSLELRTIVAAYLRRVRGADAHPDSIVVCSGFTQGLGLVLRALARSGRTVLGVEDPGHPNWAEIARRAGLEITSVPVDPDGARLDATDRRTQVALLAPAHQIPTGVVLAPERRLQAVAWTADRDGYLIEDDYDAEFRYDRQAVGVLQGLRPDRTFLVGSASKALAPALRLGWILCPPDLRDLVAEEKFHADRGTAALDQLALARLLQSGRYDRHLRRMRAAYARKRATLIDALARQAPQATVTGLAAGFHAVVALPDNATETAIADAAAERGVGVNPMSRFRLTGAKEPPQLVLGFGNLTEPAIRRGIATIADLLG
jgi:GntR family transcriptional regulator/MocR family aminotransferase